ncbi:MAG: dipeptidase [Planctomycetes bacterium]|nr:dipeptidase [Planctomycetota bacterium]
MPWFDAHLDLSYLALLGRDMTARLDQPTGGPQPAALTFPSLAEGGVRWAMGTIFINPGKPGETWGYSDASDPDGAHRAGARQLDIYHDWERRGLIKIVRTARDLDDPAPPLRVLILMEGADAIRTPDEAAWWHERGLRVVGMSWSKGTRYAAGDGMLDGRTGLTDAGRALVKSFDQLGITHDLAHLDDRAALEILSLTDRPVINSHSASRTLQGDNKTRHISDEFIRAIAQRGGVVGLPLYTRFLTAHPNTRATLQRTLDHVTHIADVMGHRRGIALGSDLDGGFTADDLPEGISRPADYVKLMDGLAKQGWSPADLAGFQSDNWLRFFRRVLV